MTTNDFWLTNFVMPSGDRTAMRVAAGRIAGYGTPPVDATLVDANGRLLLPSLIEGHVHLDKVLWGTPWPGYRSGTTVKERIAREKAYRTSLSTPVETRGALLVEAEIAFGTGHMRTHVDIDTDWGLTNLEAVLRIRERYAAQIDIEIVAFPQSGILAAPGTAPGLSQSIAYGGTRNSPVSLRPPRSPGAYEIWYLDDARRQILHRTTVSIVAPAGSTAVQPVAGGPAAASTNGVTLVAPLTVRLGEWISVEWTGPSNSQDYIVLAARGTAPGLRESIAYGGARNSPVSLRPPRAPGAYEVWYLDDARKQILHRVPVAITP